MPPTPSEPVLALLAGGLGTRLGPATAHLPKSLVPVAGRPFIEHQLALIADNNWTEVVVCTGHLGRMIEDHVGDGAAWGVHVRYSHDGPELRGTAGALRHALPLLGETFLVLYGDSYLDAIRYRDVWTTLQHGADLAVMSVFLNHNEWDRSNSLVEHARVLRYDKAGPTADMNHIDYGIGALHAIALRMCAHPDLAEVYRQCAAAGLLGAATAHHRFYEIGTPAGWADTEAHLRRKAAHERRLAAREFREPRPWAKIIA